MTTKPKAKKFRIRRSPHQMATAEKLPEPNAESEAPAAPMPEVAPLAAVPTEGGGPEQPLSDRAARRQARLARSAERRAKSGAADDASPMPTAPEEAHDGLASVAEAGAPAAAERPAMRRTRAAPATGGTSAPPSSIPTAAAPATSGLSPEQELAQIRQEGLTGRQLRMARRLAQKHGLAATSDYDAVRLLRAQGLDPFRRSNMLDMAAPDGLPAVSGAAQLPQTQAEGGQNLPSMEMASPTERRVREIGDIQKDIARRRRRKMMLMISRLAAFVMLPTILAGWYYYKVATPMYATNSEFLIIQSESAGAGGGLGGLFSGTQLATNSDSIATQSYLQSKDAMLRLDADEGFKSVFADPTIDPLQRLAENPSNEQAYKVYKKYVKIGYDPTEGVIRMEVSAPDPGISARYSEALIDYAEQRVDELSQRKREDQVKDARRSLEDAKADRREAQARLVELQEGTVLDPEGLIASLRQQISTYEIELQEKQLELTQLLDNARPNEARVEGARGSIRRLQGVLQALQERMTAAKEGDDSLAKQTSAIQIAQADLATADLIMQSALQTLKQTELEASRQVRYLTTSVAPVASEDPSYPRAFENTILSFLIFSGIYLMISLTGSILKEQVSG
ncbi:capsule biosynthesis protein [Cognatishimia sp. SS12]|uniref:capsule biosynthesis protein n=1 Tax=Cognatishimia sp. SS12 TaxID=2979465 RepID=UPI00232B5304|nr:capsule biosynthesis protein [Cognatishimia sp. SS12]MDC0739004.1 capsule biosynthesis protein [Cognatishimia sp. SS12]